MYIHTLYVSENNLRNDLGALPPSRKNYRIAGYFVGLIFCGLLLVWQFIVLIFVVDSLHGL